MPSIEPPAALKTALAESITTGSFIDTKFYVFSRMSPDEKIDKPRAVFANSFILTQQSEYFSSMFSSGFSEAAMKNMNGGFPDDEKPYVESYDYGMDSDLDEEEDVDDSAAESVTETSTHEVIGPLGDPKRYGRVVVIRNAPYVTFHAVVGFLHTGEIEFKQSCVPRPGFFRSSSKSVYRLADKFGLDELKRLTLEHIRQNITSWDSVDEVFSEFSSRYPEIRELEIRNLIRALQSPSESGATREKLMVMLDQFGQGDYSYSGEGVILLVEELLKNTGCGGFPKTLEIPPPLPRWPAPSLPADLTMAVMNALTSGVFIDTRIDAISTRLASDCTFTSLYSSRVALGPYYSRLKSLASEHDLNDDGYGTDSDLEEEAKPDPSLGDSKKPDRWEATHAVTTYKVQVGAAGTWKSVLCYLYTESCSFAFLRSQGQDLRPKETICYIGYVPPCSPKSIFILARHLGIDSLQTLANRDLKFKTTSYNVVEELFSKFSSRHPEILSYQTDNLNAHMTSELVVEQLKEKIRNTASGRSLHHSEALKSIIGTFIPVVEKQSAPLETSKPAQRYRCLYCPCKGLKIICPRCHRTRQPIH